MGSTKQAQIQVRQVDRFPVLEELQANLDRFWAESGALPELDGPTADLILNGPTANGCTIAADSEPKRMELLVLRFIVEGAPRQERYVFPAASLLRIQERLAQISAGTPICEVIHMLTGIVHVLRRCGSPVAANGLLSVLHRLAERELRRLRSGDREFRARRLEEMAAQLAREQGRASTVFDGRYRDEAGFRYSAVPAKSLIRWLPG